MAPPTNMYLSASTIGRRESLSDEVSNVSPVDTKFYSKIGKSPDGKPKQSKHEWLTDVVPPVTDNAQPEGNTWTAAAITAATRLYNTLQIQDRIFSISNSLLETDSAGGVTQEGYQTALYMKALAQDSERAALRGVRNDTDNRQMRGALNWTQTNLDKAADATLNADGTITGGTNRQLDETIFKNVTENIFNNSTGTPDTVYCPSGLVTRFTAMAGAGNYRQMVEEGKLNSYVDVFATEYDFVFQIKPHRLMPANTVFICDHKTWKKAIFRPAKKTQLALTADGKSWAIVQEWCIEARAETCDGRITNVN